MEGYFTSAGQGEAGDPDEDAGIVVPIIRTAKIFFLPTWRPSATVSMPSPAATTLADGISAASVADPPAYLTIFYPRSMSACIRVRLRPAAPPETPRLAGAGGDHALPKLVLSTSRLSVEPERAIWSPLETTQSQAFDGSPVPFRQRQPP
jgi:hypothetical protein